MGNSVVKQPNGLYAIFSSYTDDFVAYDATLEEVEEHFIDNYRDTIKKHIQDSIKRNTIKEKLETVKRVHGKEIYEIAKKEVGL